MDWKRLTASALMLGLLALPASAASITPQTTMKEIRDDPDIRASGLYTYTYVWERDCEKLSTSRDDETLAEVVDDTSAEACAAGLNYLAQVYHVGVQVYDDAKHGVGIGVGTDAEGWVADAAAFWKSVSEE